MLKMEQSTTKEERLKRIEEILLSVNKLTYFILGNLILILII